MFIILLFACIKRCCSFVVIVVVMCDGAGLHWCVRIDDEKRAAEAAWGIASQSALENLKSIAQKRTDIFGVGELEAHIGHTVRAYTISSFPFHFNIFMMIIGIVIIVNVVVFVVSVVVVVVVVVVVFVVVAVVAVVCVVCVVVAAVAVVCVLSSRGTHCKCVRSMQIVCVGAYRSMKTESRRKQSGTLPSDGTQMKTTQRARTRQTRPLASLHCLFHPCLQCKAQQ
jgi:hypothetical protein